MSPVAEVTILSSRVFKASYVTIDKDNAVNIEVMDSSRFIQAQPPPVAAEKEIEDAKMSDEKKAEKIIRRAKEEADEILIKARNDAKKIENDAKARSEAESKKIFEARRKEGYQQGYQDGTKEAEAIKQQAQQTYKEAIARKEEMLNAAEGDLLQLMTRILEKLLGNAVYMNPQVILHLIRQGFSGSTINGDVNIHVSGEDYEEVLQHKDELLPLVDGSVKLEVLKDLSLNKGDCIIETPFGNIDCSLERQFASLKQDLYHILENANYE